MPYSGAHSAFLDELLLIVREGALFDVSIVQDGSDQRTISTFDFDYVGLDGSSGLNDAGEIVYTLTFTDGTSGVFVTQLIPAPGVAGLFGLAVIAAVRRRR